MHNMIQTGSFKKNDVTSFTSADYKIVTTIDNIYWMTIVITGDAGTQVHFSNIHVTEVK